MFSGVGIKEEGSRGCDDTSLQGGDLAECLILSGRR